MENLHSQNPEGEGETIEGITQSKLVRGIFWMISISLFLFFLPVFNGLAAGFVGGFKVGGTKNALLASLLPALALLCVLWALLSWVNLPQLGDRGDIVRAALCLLASLAMILGAALGGTVAERGLDPWTRA